MTRLYRPLHFGAGLTVLAVACALLLQTQSLRAFGKQCCGDDNVGCTVMYDWPCDDTCPPAPCCTSDYCPIE